MRRLTNEQMDAYDYLKENLEKNNLKDEFVQRLKKAEHASGQQNYMLGFNNLV